MHSTLSFALRLLTSLFGYILLVLLVLVGIIAALAGASDSFQGPRRLRQTWKDESYLCDRCNEVDFEALLTTRPTKRYGTRLPYGRFWNMNVTGDIRGCESCDHRGCRFCDLLQQLVERNKVGLRDMWVKVALNREFNALRITISTSSEWKTKGEKRERRWKINPIEPQWAMFSPEAKLEKIIVNGRNFLENFNAPENLMEGIDIELTKKWIKDCSKEHTSSYYHGKRPHSQEGPTTYTRSTSTHRPALPHRNSSWRRRLFRSLFKGKNDATESAATYRNTAVPIVPIIVEPPKTLRLVDVENWCIETIPYDPSGEGLPQFVALSYVWGIEHSPQLQVNNQNQWAISGALRTVNLPKTIKDAIHCVSMLGEKYLWIDRLCIVQDSKKEKANTIKHMHGIYMNAYLTIVAGFGHSASSGLQGYSAAAPWSPESYYIRGIELSLAPVVGFDELRESAWVTRGWTFQEIVCSRRSLVLMKSSAAVWCPKSIHYQDRRGTSVLPHPKWATGFNPMSFEPAVENGSEGQRKPELYERKLEDLLKAYLPRRLTSDDDYLNAFSGVLGYLEAELGEHHHGLPEKIFHRMIAWSSNSIVSEGGLERPTWSWVSWKFADGEVSFRIPEGDSIISFYRGDELDNPISSPQQSGQGNANPLDEARHAHFKPDKAKMKKQVSSLGSKANSTSKQYFSHRRLQNLREATSTTPTPTTDDFLRNHVLVFFTSAVSLSMHKSYYRHYNSNLERWDIHERSGRQVTSITIPTFIEWQEREGIFIVIQSRLSIAPSSVSYRLMLIQNAGLVFRRICITENFIDASRWHSLIGMSSKNPERMLVILG